MAIAPTGAIYKTLTFDGENSGSYGVYITGEAVYNAPERDVEMITIPGRNGAYALDKGRFQNIEVTYPAGMFADNEVNWAQAISDFRNMLCSKRGYVRLTDEYNPNEYRLAIYKSGLEVDPKQLRAGEFDITFECKPQRFLTSGEEKVTMGVWGQVETETGSIVTIEADDTTAIKDVTADIEPIQSGSGTPSPDNPRPISGHTDVVVSRASGQLIDTSTNESGAIDASGNEVANATFNRTDFIPIDKARICIKTNLASGYVIRVHGYSASKAWVQQIKTITTDGTDLLVGETVPSGVAYVRLSYPTVGVNNTELWQADTYTTALGTTVYKGTLDVTTGELTVTHAIVTYDGTETWDMYSVAQGNLFRHTQSDRKAGEIYPLGAYCNRFEVVANANRTNGTMSSPTSGSEYALDFIYDACTTEAQWRTWLSSNNVQVLYPLATPTTTTLTAQQISTLLGQNNVWADTGDVTVQYGADPNKLVNPTLFDASPILEVTGYGNITFAGQTVTINNSVLGNIDLTAQYNSGNLYPTYYSQTYKTLATIVMDTADLESGDTISIKDMTISMTGNTYSQPNIVSATLVSQGDFKSVSLSVLNSTTTNAVLVLDNISFAYGTSADSAAFTCTAQWNNSNGTYYTFDPYFYVAYDGDSTIEIKGKKVDANPAIITMPPIVGSSTKSLIGSTMYIDLDIGEAYKIESGSAVSINNIVQIPAKLPVIPSGVVLFTYDNTYSSVKVTPRWWKV